MKNKRLISEKQVSTAEPRFRRSLLAVAIMSCMAPAYAQNTAESSNGESGTQVSSPESNAESADNSNADVYEEIVVTGQRSALETALDLKRESNTIGDSLVFDEAGKVPSTSLLEILERAPGVTMNRIRAGSEGSPDGFSFEGSGLQVRGLNKTKTLVNGREVFSANGGSGLSWADVGPELLKAATVYKASRADLIEGGVSGTVNLETHMPFDFDGFKANAALAADYGDFSEKTTPAVSAMISNRFDSDIGEIGILLDAAYSEIASHDSNIIVPPYYATNFNDERVYAPGVIRYTQDQFERIRKGYYGALQWRPNENLEFFYTTFISQRTSDRDTQILTMEPNAPVGIYSEGAQFNDGFLVSGVITSADINDPLVPDDLNFVPGPDEIDEESGELLRRPGGQAVAMNSSFTPSFSKTADYSTGFKYEGEGWDVSGSYQYVKAKSSSGKYSLGGAVNGNIVQTTLNMGGDRPSATFGSELSSAPEDALVSRINWLDMTNQGDAHAVQLDAGFDLDNGFFKKVAAGGRIADREESDSFVGTWWSATGRNWNGVPRASAATAPEGDFYLEEFSDFFKGDVTVPGSAWVGTRQVNSSDQFERVYDTYLACGPDLHYQCSNPEDTTYLYGDPDQPRRNRNFDQLPTFYVTKHKTQSLYVMTGFENMGNAWYTNFSGNVGVRWVNYDIESQGNFTYNGGERYYASLADAQASVDEMGGIENVNDYLTVDADGDGNADNAEPPRVLGSSDYETQRAGSFSEGYFLPSFNIKFEPVEDWVMRYALTRTLTPPRYPDIRAQGTASIRTTENPINQDLDAEYPDVDVSIPAIFAGYENETGNPFLEPEISLNHDISLEWYPAKGSSLYLSLFHKTIDNYITFNNFEAPASDFFAEENYPQSVPVNESEGSGSFLDGAVSSRTNFNANKETIVSGFELGGRTYFDSLSGWLSGFGVDGNLTYIDNDAPDAFALDINGDPLNVPVIGLSEWAYTATLLYDLDKISARLSYNWRDRYLTTTNDSNTTRTYTDPFDGDTIQIGLPVYSAESGRLDASVSYELREGMNVKLNIQNLTDEYQRTEMEIMKGRFVDRAVFVTDRRISLHFGFDF